MGSRLVRLLQLAASGELAAAHAYRGHAASVSDPAERDRIRDIRLEELDHRRQIIEMLHVLGARPSRWLEWKMALIGRAIGLFCHIGGWYLPMYGAGRLERGNILEYEIAARLAIEEGRTEFVDSLLRMAEVEWEHECYFRVRADSHWMSRFIRTWDPPPPKASIRASIILNSADTIL